MWRCVRDDHRRLFRDSPSAPGRRTGRWSADGPYRGCAPHQRNPDRLVCHSHGIADRVHSDGQARSCLMRARREAGDDGIGLTRPGHRACRRKSDQGRPKAPRGKLSQPWTSLHFAIAFLCSRAHQTGIRGDNRAMRAVAGRRRWLERRRYDGSNDPRPRRFDRVDPD